MPPPTKRVCRATSWSSTSPARPARHAEAEPCQPDQGWDWNSAREKHPAASPPHGSAPTCAWSCQGSTSTNAPVASRRRPGPYRWLSERSIGSAGSGAEAVTQVLGHGWSPPRSQACRSSSTRAGGAPCKPPTLHRSESRKLATARPSASQPRTRSGRGHAGSTSTSGSGRDSRSSHRRARLRSSPTARPLSAHGPSSSRHRPPMNRPEHRGPSRRCGGSTGVPGRLDQADVEPSSHLSMVHSPRLGSVGLGTHT